MWTLLSHSYPLPAACLTYHPGVELLLHRHHSKVSVTSTHLAGTAATFDGIQLLGGGLTTTPNIHLTSAWSHHSNGSLVHGTWPAQETPHKTHMLLWVCIPCHHPFFCCCLAVSSSKPFMGFIFKNCSSSKPWTAHELGQLHLRCSDSVSTSKFMRKNGQILSDKSQNTYTAITSYTCHRSKLLHRVTLLTGLLGTVLKLCYIMFYRRYLY